MAKKIVLIVDDDRAVLGLVGIILEKLGHVVLKARNAGQALDLFQEHKPLDALITDVRLGEMDGFKLGEALRLNQPSLRILFISGSISDASSLLVEKKIPRNGYFLHKPFMPRELSDMMGIMLPRAA